MDSLESSWRTYEAIGEWIRSADSKATTLLGAEGVIVGLVGSRIVSQQLTAISWISLILFGISAVMTFYFCIRCLNPTLKVGEATSKVSFAHIAQRYMRGEDYAKEVCKEWCSPEAVQKEVCCQIWANSRVAWKKYQLVAKSIPAFAISVIFAIVTLALF